MPWFVIAVIHKRECSPSWAGSLAQGDPWRARSVHVPKGRGPFTSWEDCAVDALVNCAPQQTATGRVTENVWLKLSSRLAMLMASAILPIALAVGGAIATRAIATVDKMGDMVLEATAAIREFKQVQVDTTSALRELRAMRVEQGKVLAKREVHIRILERTGPSASAVRRN